MTTIRPLRDYVFFQFIDPTTSTRFGGKTRSGIEIPFQILEQAGKARWVQVTHVGPEVTTPEVKPGAYILLEAGKWSSGFVIDGERYWQTKEEWCACVDDQPHYTFD